MKRKWMVLWVLLSLFLIPAALGEDITALSVEPEAQEVAFDLTEPAPEPIISKGSAEPISLSDSGITVDDISNQTFTGETVMAAAIQTVVRIDPPRETEYVYTVKPENILEELPAQLKGELQEQLEEAQIDVIWSCEDYGEREEGVFLFTAVCDPEKYIYDDTKVTMPTVTVTVGREFELSDNADGTRTIEKWNRPGETLVIPARIDGKAVTAVRKDAFTEAATLTSVTLTDTIRSVPTDAFSELVRPTTVKLIVTGDTLMETADSFYHIINGVKETVSLPWAVTDFDVRTGGSLSFKKDETKETRYVTIKLKGEKPHKIYDSTVNLNWQEKVNGETVEHKYVFSEWFTINGLESGDTFSLETFKGQYDSADAGTNHTITFTFTPKGTQSSGNKYNYVLRDSDKTLKVTGCTIEPKVLTITPAPATKVYGANDPYITPKSASGMMEADKERYKAGTLRFEGRMSYEGGDDVGEHKITPGTLKLGDNYTIAVAEAYMTITAKPISDSDITVSIGNQKYTGSAVTPDLTVEYGTRTLSKGKDYEVSFSNNTEAGLATATLRGIGNYTGEKTAQFRILKTSDGSISGHSSSTYTDSTTIASLDEAHFPDSAFRRYLAEYCDTSSDGGLQEFEINAVTSMDVSSSGIRSLKGIELFTQLTSLNCSYNQLTTLDLSKNTRLTQLYCMNNRLTEINVSKNTTLTLLNCKSNQLAELKLSGCPRLRKLYCYGNSLNRLDISSCAALISTLETGRANTSGTYAEYTMDDYGVLAFDKTVTLVTVMEPDFVLPKALVTIEAEAFRGCDFRYVKISKGAKTIGSLAFADCESLKHIYIPASVVQIASDAFENVSPALTIHGVAGSAAQTYAESHGYDFIEE